MRMTKKRLFVGFASVIVILIVTLIIMFSKLGQNENKSININLYYFNETGTTIAEKPSEIVYEEDDDLTRVVIEKLMAGPGDGKLKPIFEKDVKLLSVIMNGKELTVNFSGEYLTQDTSKNFLTTYAVVKSLCQLDRVDKVLVTVSGEEICDMEGNKIGFLSDKDIDLISDEITQDSKNIVLYFPDKSSDKLLSEQRKIKINDTVPIEQYLVNELIKGTQSTKARNVISGDTVLISAQTTDNTCFVNFKSSFIEKNSGNPANEKLVIYSIVNSLCELRDVNFVQFLIDGKKTDKFGSIDISNFFIKEKNVNAG